MALGVGNTLDGNDSTAEQKTELRGATGLVITTAGLAILLEVSMITLRFCNFVWLVKMKIKIILVFVSGIKKLCH